MHMPLAPVRAEAAHADLSSALAVSFIWLKTGSTDAPGLAWMVQPRLVLNPRCRRRRADSPLGIRQRGEAVSRNSARCVRSWRVAMNSAQSFVRLAAFSSDQEPASAAAAVSRACSPNRSSTMACASPRIGCNCRTSFASVVTALTGMICCGVTTSCAV
jgi:hypothetical protein